MSFGSYDQVRLEHPTDWVRTDANVNGEWDIIDRVNALQPLGSTALYDGTAVGIESLSQEPQPKAVIVFTDGSSNDDRVHSINTVIQKAINEGVPLYTIGLGLDPQNLKDMAADTDGRYYYAPTASDMAAIYQDIAAHLRSRYSLTYTTHNPAYDGQLREVTVQESHFMTTGRGTYLPNARPVIELDQATLQLEDVSQLANIGLPISGHITDLDAVPSGQTLTATLFYRAATAASFASTNLSLADQGGGVYSFSGQIPAASVQSPAVQYYIRASDGVLETFEPYNHGQLPRSIPVLPNRAPVIDHQAVTSSGLGADVQISAIITDLDAGDFISQARLFYRIHSAVQTTPYRAIAMTNPSGQSFTGIIPGADMTTAGVDYFLSAWDRDGARTDHGTANQPHQIRAGSSLQVTIEPAAASTAGAQWRVDGGAWQQSGATLPLSPGTYRVSYKNLTEWQAPADQNVTVTANQLTTQTATYAGASLSVTIEPSSARDAGARWRVDGGAWQDSGATLTLGAGSHTISYENISGWIAPDDETLNLTVQQTTSITGTYVQPGSLRVTIEPAAAQEDGAMWMVNGGAWQTSGATLTLAPGTYSVSPKGIAGWVKPADVSVTIAAGQTTAASIVYPHSLNLFGMGQTYYGQLGDGSTSNYYSPTRIRSSGVAEIATSDGHTMFITTSGELWAMGDNRGGQLGDGTTTDRATPVRIRDSGVAAVAAGSGHSLFVTTTGELWAMGYNSDGQLGDGTTTNRSTPVRIRSSGVAAVATGYSHSFFVTTSGELFAMGKNEYGQLGDGTTTNRSSPVRIRSSGVAKIAAAWYHSLFVTTSGELWGMGSNSEGQLGDGTTTNRYSPVRIWDSEVADVKAARRHSVFFATSGDLLVMGSGELGALGGGDYESHLTNPVQISSGNVSRMAANSSGSFFVTKSGELWAMGGNWSGQLGDGTNMNRSTPIRIRDSNVAQVAAIWAHSLFVTTSGELWAMGDNSSGQLGDGTTTDQSTPVRIRSSGVAAVAAGKFHSLFVTTSGELWAMGGNWFGQLGDGTTTNRSTPVRIRSGGVAAVAAGDFHSLFVTTSGELWAMGLNGYGQLGNGTTTNRSTPVRIRSGGVAAVAAGDSHSLFVTTSGELWAMGNNSSGQLGDGTTTNRSTPVRIRSSGVATVAAGGYGSLFVTISGELWAMGSNSLGELGDGTTTNRSTPVRIQDSGVADVAKGHFHTLFSKYDLVYDYGSLDVTIQPATARTAGAQWRVYGSEWLNSGAILEGLAPGAHTVNYKSVAGWDAPTDHSITVRADETTMVTETYSVAQHIVTPFVGIGGSLSPSTPQSVLHDAITSFRVTPDSGYSISSVSGCDGSLSGTTYTTGAITQACTVTASFSQLSHTVTASAGTGGGISPSSRTVTHGATTSFTVTPNTGYSIGNVSGCDGSLSGTTYTTGAITSSCQMTADFTENTYVIQFTASPRAGGTVSCTPNPVNHGEDSTCTASPASGYSFSDWSGDCTGTSPNCTLSAVTETKQMTAIFESIGGGDCQTTALSLTEPVLTGTDSWRSEQSIQVAGAVSVDRGAALDLTAPRITFAPDFRVNAGGRLTATSATVRCTIEAASESAIAQRTLAEPLGPVLIAHPEALPLWLTERLAGLGIDPTALTNGLLDADEHWLILETTQVLHPADDNGVSDIYRLDLLSDRLELISLTAEGAAGNGASRDPAADAFGERIVFTSAASDLAPGDANGVSDLFLRDLALGLTERLTQADQASAHPAVDAAGITLVYDQSTEAGPRQILGQALNDGPSAEVVSLSDAESEAASTDAYRPALSADGRYLAYLSRTSGDCTLVLHDFDRRRTHRQPCPDTEDEDETARVTFSPEGDALFWHTPRQSPPMILDNPLAETRP